MTTARAQAVLFLLAFGGGAVAADWPQFLGPNRDGVSAEGGLNLAWTADGPPVLWERPIGVGFSSPVVAGGRVVVMHRQGDTLVVECLAAADGKPRWKFETPTSYRDMYGMGDGPRSTPAVADGRVFALDPDGRLFCLDLESGGKKWERPLNEDYAVRQGFFGVSTSPIVEGGKVIINVGGRTAGIVALDAGTGRETWKATTHEAGYSSPVAATVGGQRSVIFFTREGIVLLDPADGAVRFSKHFRARINASVNAAAPVVLGDHLFFSASYGTGAVLLNVRGGGDEVWKSDQVLSCHYNTPVRSGEVLFGVDGRQEEGARLRCVEWKTGTVRWTQEQFGCATLIRAGDRVVALTESGDLVGFDASPEGYKETSRARLLRAPCRSHPALADGRLYARDDTRVICLNVRK